MKALQQGLNTKYSLSLLQLSLLIFITDLMVLLFIWTEQPFVAILFSGLSAYLFWRALESCKKQKNDQNIGLYFLFWGLFELSLSLILWDTHRQLKIYQNQWLSPLQISSFSTPEIVFLYLLQGLKGVGVLQSWWDQKPKKVFVFNVFKVLGVLFFVLGLYVFLTPLDSWDTFLSSGFLNSYWVALILLIHVGLFFVVFYRKIEYVYLYVLFVFIFDVLWLAKDIHFYFVLDRSPQEKIWQTFPQNPFYQELGIRQPGWNQLQIERLGEVYRSLSKGIWLGLLMFFADLSLWWVYAYQQTISFCKE